MLSTQEVLEIAKLAGLTLTPLEVEKYRSQLSSVLGYVSELKRVNTNGLKPTSQTTGLKNALRHDQLDHFSSLSQESALSSASRKNKGYFVVDAILEK